ncbi:MAG: 5-oxoprolinase subunit PxpB [Bacteroidota bacterium]
MLVTYDPKQISAFSLKEWIYDLEITDPPLATGKQHILPVVYGGEYGPDLDEVASLLNLTAKRVIKFHTSVEYRVYQMGYQPGFAFLGLTSQKLEISRRDSPRSLVPAGSVGLAGRQTGIYPHDAPGGWQLIGRCPWSLWRSDTEPNARLKAGDTVKFYAITAKDWDAEKERGYTWTK